MSFRLKIAVGFTLLASFGLRTALTFFDSHLPLTAAELSTGVPLKRVGTACGPSMSLTRMSSVNIQFDSARLTLSFDGVDALGMPWHVETAPHGLGCYLWQADLDLNGTEDLIVAYYTGGNGLAPQTGLTMLMMDAMGRPVPWDIAGYFEVDSTGLKDLLDLNHDGHPELIQMGFDDGYWMTSAYEARDSHWRRFDGNLASRVFPLHTRFTSRPNHQPTFPEPNRSPFNPNFSNVIGGTQTAVREFQYTPWESNRPDHLDLLYCCRSMTLVLEDGRRCELSHFPTVIVERSSTRSIGLVPGLVVPLLEEISRDRLPVWITGQTENGKCSPVLIWATANVN